MTSEQPGYANKADLTALEQQHEEWFNSVDTSHIRPLDDDWAMHPFWADKEDLCDESTAAGKLMADMQAEFTPEERAASCKETGNEMLAQGKKLRKKQPLRQAIEKYSEGLNVLNAAKSKDMLLWCHLYSNRSAVESLLGNWRNALESAKWAIKANATHIKSYCRAAKAAQELRRWSETIQICETGLSVEADASELKTMLKTASENLQKEELKAEKARRAEEQRLAPFRRMAAAIMSRGVRMTRPQFGWQTNSEQSSLPCLDAEGVLHFPVLLFYPEVNPYHDTIEDCTEHDIIGTHLDEMFGPEAPPLPWDEQGAYVRDRIELYYLSHAGTVLKEAQLVDAFQGLFPENYVEMGCQKYGPKTSTMVKVEESCKLLDLLQREDHIMPGVPVLWVLSRGSDYADMFLKTFDPRNATKSM